MNEPSDLTEGHTVRRFDGELASLRLAVLEMAGLVLNQLDDAVRALVDGDVDLAREVIARDGEVNGYDQRIDEQAVQVLARRAPVATDLRVVMSIVRTVRNLERVGDEAKKIALYAMQIHEASGARLTLFYRDVKLMARLARSLLKDAIECFDTLDAERAIRVKARDQEIDDEFRSAMRHLVSISMEDQRFLRHTISTVLVIKSLERIGDHAVIIAEAAAYLVRGIDIRHEQAPGATQQMAG